MSSRPSAAAGAGRAASSISTSDVRIRGEEKYLPDSTQPPARPVHAAIAGHAARSGSKRARGRIRASSTPTRTREIAANGGESSATMPFIAQLHPVSASLGANYEFAAGWRAGLSLSHSERAPAIDELFANGPHGGSAAVPDRRPRPQQGDAAIRPNSASTTRPARCTSRAASITAASPTSFSRPRPARSRTACRSTISGRARPNYYGFELQSDAKFGKALGIDWGGEVVADAVRATIKGFGPAPQIPPFRVLGALTGSRGQVDGRLEVERAFGPRPHRADRDRRRQAITMVNASFDWHPFAANPELTLSLQGNNLFDVDARRAPASSRIIAPLAGRDIRLTARGRLLAGRKEAARRRGCRTASWKRTWGETVRRAGLNVDSGGDRLELADPFAKVRDLDPAAGRRKSAVAGSLGQLHLLELDQPPQALRPRDSRRRPGDMLA